ncbi:phosphoglycolate phosphatase [Thorsellia kenyensis]|uniref:phosphoglycolate phosphatase n=1 Tax=Thorsellia kenyensis TaxID=1549888 RepID=A0ABV6CDM9_9GAMM
MNTQPLKYLSSKIQAIGFDLDGTIVDSLPGIHQALNLALIASELSPVDEYQTKGFIGNGIDILLRKTIETIKGSDAYYSFDFSSLRKRFDAFYSELMTDGTQLYPNVFSTLHALKQKQIPLVLITNKPSQFLPELLNGLGLSKMFCLVLGADDVKEKKPHPAPIFQTLGSLGILTNEFLFVGDSKNDIECAKNAGVLSVGLTYGYNYHQPIADAKPDFVFDDFAQLLNLFH